MEYPDGWTVEENKLTKLFLRKDFVDAVAFIDAIVPLAEAMKHHPDVLLSEYKKVTVMLMTHETNSIMDKDIELAKQIDQIVL